MYFSYILAHHFLYFFDTIYRLRINITHRVEMLESIKNSLRNSYLYYDDHKVHSYECFYDVIERYFLYFHNYQKLQGYYGVLNLVNIKIKKLKFNKQYHLNRIIVQSLNKRFFDRLKSVYKPFEEKEEKDEKESEWRYHRREEYVAESLLGPVSEVPMPLAVRHRRTFDEMDSDYDPAADEDVEINDNLNENENDLNDDRNEYVTPPPPPRRRRRTG